MKRQWSPEELIEHFILLPQEEALLPIAIANSRPHNRLGFALLLKFFQMESRFPRHAGEIPPAVVTFLAHQLKLSAEDLSGYKWKGRTLKKHRDQIRAYLGFRPMTLADQQALKAWLTQEVIPFGSHFDALRNQVAGWLSQQCIEPPAPKELTRLIQSANRAHEQAFCEQIAAKILASARLAMDQLLKTKTALEDDEAQFHQSEFNRLKSDPGRLGLKSLLQEIEKLQNIRQLELPPGLFEQVSAKLLLQYRRRASAELAGQLRSHPAATRYTLVAAFCHQRGQEILDNLVELLVQIVHRLRINAERRVERELIADFKRVSGKDIILYKIAEAALAHPERPVRDVIYPIASPEKLTALLKEQQSTGVTYQEKVYTKIRSSYLHHYRRMVPEILNTLEFQSNNEIHQPIIQALALLKRSQGRDYPYFSDSDEVITTGVLKSSQRELVVETDSQGQERINRVNYEICLLQALRESLRSREIWVRGTQRYGNPEQDLPQDFEQLRDNYYQALNHPTNAESFIAQLQQQMTEALSTLEQGLPQNKQVRIQSRRHGWISVSPLLPQSDPNNLADLKQELTHRWPLTSLLEILKETDLRVNFTEQFRTVASREQLERTTLQRRLLLALYGLGTNTGLARVCAGVKNETYANLMYVKRNFIHTEHLRNAIAQVVNATLQARLAHIWGDATTACASDSKKFGAWDQNLMTEWHARYGGRGVMIYWHVENNSPDSFLRGKSLE